MNRKYFIDTSVVINYLKGDQKWIRVLNGLKNELYINHIVVAELSEGIYRVGNPRKMENAIDDFISGMNEILPLDVITAKRFGGIRANLRKQGKEVEDFDILIGATCLSYDLTLITANRKHFERIDDLNIVVLDDLQG